MSSGSLLELFLTTEEDRVGAVKNAASYLLCLHSPVIAEYLISANLHWEILENERENYVWLKSNYAVILEGLPDFDRIYVFYCHSVNNGFNRFVEVVQGLVSHHVPLHTGVNRLPWAVHPPLSLLRERSEAWQRYKLLRSSHSRFSIHYLTVLGFFNEINSRYGEFVLHSRCQYEQALIDSSECSKLFHS